jgi:RimJ/RimL family protein N-acetyltransferase
MDKRSSSAGPSDSPLSRGASRLHYLGARAVPGLAVYGLLSRLFGYRATDCVWVDLEHWRPVSGETVAFEIRPVSVEEISSEAELKGENPEDAERALGSGAEVLGAFRDGSIISSLWISPHPPSLNGGLKLEFDERLAFFYRAFTLPEFRGMGLMPAVLRAALGRCALRGYRGAVACIDIANRPSRNAFRTAGFKRVVTIRYAKIFGKHMFHPSRRQEKPCFRVQPLAKNHASDSPRSH